MEGSNELRYIGNRTIIIYSNCRFLHPKKKQDEWSEAPIPKNSRQYLALNYSFYTKPCRRRRRVSRLETRNSGRVPHKEARELRVSRKPSARARKKSFVNPPTWTPPTNPNPRMTHKVLERVKLFKNARKGSNKKNEMRGDKIDRPKL